MARGMIQCGGGRVNKSEMIQEFAASLILIVCVSAFAVCGNCEEGTTDKTGNTGVFLSVARETEMKDGVREISYEQLMKIRGSAEKYMFLDVLSPDSYAKGHIDGALSFPVDTIDAQTAEKRLSKTDNVIVYCGSFQCTASTDSAKKLSGLGYNVVDYKGGLKEWQEKGNKLVSEQSKM